MTPMRKLLMVNAVMYVSLLLTSCQPAHAGFSGDTGYREAEYSHADYGGNSVTKDADDYGGGGAVKTDYSQ